MLHDPRYDTRIIGLKAIALSGGEYGPFFDQGVLHVIGQIEAAGHFTPSPLRALIALENEIPHLITAAERASLRRELQVRGWTVEQGAAYSRGIGTAEMELSDYREPDS